MTGMYDFFSATKREIVTRAQNNRELTLTAGAFFLASVGSDMSNLVLYAATGEPSEILARVTTGFFVGAVTTFGAAMTIDSIKDSIDNYLLNRALSDNPDEETFDKGHFEQAKSARF